MALRDRRQRHARALLFMSLPLLAYCGVMAIAFDLFVIGYEEPTLERRFGATYTAYRQSVPRWMPRPPRRG
jgi:protein-S-isoprenylcysteine O-methyltransferase Ste14